MRLSILVLVFLLAALLLPQAAHAEASEALQNLYEVSGVQVDVTAESAVAARDQALIEAQRKGFEALYERLVLDETGAGTPPVLAAGDMQRLVQGFEVEEERSSAVRYIARLSVRYNPDDVRRYFTDRNLRFAEFSSQPLVVVPLYGAASSWVLWDSPNPWRAAWALEEGNDGADSGDLVPILLPLGDITDARSLNVTQAWQREHPPLNRLMSRYDAGGALVVVARVEDGTIANPLALKIFAFRHENDGAERSFELTTRRISGEAVPAFMARAVTLTRDQANEDWKRTVSIDPATVAEDMSLFMSLSRLQDWVRAEERLARVTAIEHVEIDSMSRSELRLNIRYRGDEALLRTAMRQAGLVLGPRPQILEPGPMPSSAAQNEDVKPGNEDVMQISVPALPAPAYELSLAEG